MLQYHGAWSVQLCYTASWYLDLDFEHRVPYNGYNRTFLIGYIIDASWNIWAARTHPNRSLWYYTIINIMMKLQVHCHLVNSSLPHMMHSLNDNDTPITTGQALNLWIFQIWTLNVRTSLIARMVVCDFTFTSVGYCGISHLEGAIQPTWIHCRGWQYWPMQDDRPEAQSNLRTWGALWYESAQWRLS